MIVNYSQGSTLRSALTRTFDGQHPCTLCKIVKAGKAAEKKQDVAKASVKFDVSLVAGVIALFPPEPLSPAFVARFSSPARFQAPLTPPPRCA
jgi:hypothetical protein